VGRPIPGTGSAPRGRTLTLPGSGTPVIRPRAPFGQIGRRSLARPGSMLVRTHHCRVRADPPLPRPFLIGQIMTIQAVIHPPERGLQSKSDPLTPAQSRKYMMGLLDDPTKADPHGPVCPFESPT